MKRILSSLVCILIGFGIGCYFGHSRLAPNQRELLEKYEHLQAVKYYNDDLTSRLVLNALEQAEHGDTNQAEEVVLEMISEYYSCIGPADFYGGDFGDTNVSGQIQTAAEKYPSIALWLRVPK